MTTFLVPKSKLDWITNNATTLTKYDDPLKISVGAASEAVEQFCNRQFELLERTETFEFADYAWRPDMIDPVFCYLAAPPMAKTMPVTIMISFDNFRSQNQLIRPQDYHVDYDKAVIRVYLSRTAWNPDLAMLMSTQRGAAVFSGVYSPGIQITYTGGFKKNTSGDNDWPWIEVPDGVQLATAIQAGYYFNMVYRGSPGLATLSGDEPSAQKKSAQPKEIGVVPEAATMLLRHVRKDALIGRRPR